MEYIFWGILIVLGGGFLFGSWFTVEQQTVRFVERFGKFKSIGTAGFNFKVPFIDRVSDSFDMRLQQISVQSETKTKDNVFVRIDVAVQYEPMPDKVYEAYYRLQEAAKQITAYVFDGVRSQVPTLALDDVFLQKNEIADAIEHNLEEHMTAFGYSIEKVLVIDVIPDEAVQNAMNEIQASTRLAQAAQQKGEADKVIIVKKAEADAEAKALAGKGVADERKAIVEGLRESVKETSEALGVKPEEVMMLVMMTQYFDTIREVGKESSTILLPSSPSGLQGLMGEIRTAIISANEVAKK